MGFCSFPQSCSRWPERSFENHQPTQNKPRLLILLKQFEQRIGRDPSFIETRNGYKTSPTTIHRWAIVSETDLCRQEHPIGNGRWAGVGVLQWSGERARKEKFLYPSSVVWLFPGGFCNGSRSCESNESKAVDEGRLVAFRTSVE